MKTLIASTALALTLAAPGFAQTAAPMGTAGGFVGNIETQGLRASDLIGARLYVAENEVDPVGGLSPDWDDVGEISDIVVGGGGDIDAVLLDIGGFLGIGERTVAVNMDNLQFVSDGPEADQFFVVMQGNRAALEGAPEFNQEFTRGRTAAVADVDTRTTGLNTQDGEGTVVVGQEETSLDSGTVVANPQTPATAVVTEGGAAVTTTTTDPEAAAADGTIVEGTTAEANVADAANTADDAVTNAGTAVEETAEATGDAVTDAATDVAQATGEAAEATGDAVTDAATDVAESADATVTTTAGAVAGAGATVLGTRPGLTREGYEMVEMDALTTEDVTGASVYDVNDERIGEIGELVMTDDGQLQDAIIDVGGFLGLGEKPVAVSFESLQVLRGESDVRVYVDTTEEALEALPAYEN